MSSGLDVQAVRAQFPILHQQVADAPLVYLDNAASTQSPAPVLDAVRHYHSHDHANVHRGAHQLSVRATRAFETARQTVADFLSAPGAALPVQPEEIIWTRGTTESINLVANCWGRANLRAGDEILLTAMEHHSNIVPWQLVAEATGAKIGVIPVTDAGELDMQEAGRLLARRPRLLAVTHVSNALGTVNPVAQLASMAHEAGALILVDGAQAIGHLPVDLHALDVDFYAFSGHKLFAPTGIGVLYGRRELLDAMPPWQGGGEMIEQVAFTGSSWAPLPWKFEAGTPNISAALGLAAAIDWLRALPSEQVAAHENNLRVHLHEGLAGLSGVRHIGGGAGQQVALASFLVQGMHPSDVGILLDQQGVAVRSGHHCAMPLMQHYGIPGTVRASCALYNTVAEVDRFLAALQQAQSFA